MTERREAKTATGRCFEDFRLGETLRHATPRTLRDGDASLYSALYGTRFAVQSAETFARGIGYPRAPIDDLLAFHVVFGKTVPDVSINAIANLGYAACRFRKAVFPGDTLFAWSEVTDAAPLPGRNDVGALRLRTVAAKNRPCADFPDREGGGYEPHVVLDLDYWALLPR